MNQFPAMIAALPREVKGLVRGWNAHELPGKVFVYTDGSAVVSVGLAGACDPALRVGDLVRAGVVVDGRTGERFADPRFQSVVVTGAGIASVREKARLFDSYG